MCFLPATYWPILQFQRNALPQIAIFGSFKRSGGATAKNELEPKLKHSVMTNLTEPSIQGNSLKDLDG